MRYLVTGGFGFIGRHLIKRILEYDKQADIISIDNMHRFPMEKQDTIRGVHAIIGDIRDYGLLNSVIHEIDYAFHLGAQSNVIGAMNDKEYTMSTNVDGTFNVLKVAQRAGAKKFIFTSSREVYGEGLTNVAIREDHPLMPLNLYGKTKMAGESLCNMMTNGFDFQTHILRLSNVYGLGDRDRVIPLWIEQAKKNEPITIYGNKIMDFIHVSDVTRALLAPVFLETPRIMNVACGIPTSLIDLAHLIKYETDSKSPIEIVEERKGEVNCFYANIDKLKNTLFEPIRTPLCRGLRKLIHEVSED